MRKMILSVLFILLCCVLAVVVGSYLLLLWELPLPKRDFAPYDLLLTEQDLGEGWIMVEDNGFLIDRRQGIRLENWNRVFHYEVDGETVLSIGNVVYRIDGKRRARAYLNSEFRIYLGKDAPSEELASRFQPLYAEDWFLAETPNFVDYYGTYEEYVVSFIVSQPSGKPMPIMETGLVTYDQIAAWFRMLDEKVGKMLGKVR